MCVWETTKKKRGILWTLINQWFEITGSSYRDSVVLQPTKPPERVHWIGNQPCRIPMQRAGRPVDRPPAVHLRRHRKREPPRWPLRSRWRDAMRSKSKCPTKFGRSHEWCPRRRRPVKSCGLRSVRKSRGRHYTIVDGHIIKLHVDLADFTFNKQGIHICQSFFVTFCIKKISQKTFIEHICIDWSIDDHKRPKCWQLAWTHLLKRTQL